MAVSHASLCTARGFQDTALEIIGPWRTRKGGFQRGSAIHRGGFSEAGLSFWPAPGNIRSRHLSTPQWWGTRIARAMSG